MPVSAGGYTSFASAPVDSDFAIASSGDNARPAATPSAIPFKKSRREILGLSDMFSRPLAFEECAWDLPSTGGAEFSGY
jgi:hypothetical protein